MWRMCWESKGSRIGSCAWKMEFGGMLINVISAYAPQTGYGPEVKEAFWTDLDEVLVSLPRQERAFIGADLNGYVCEGNTGDEDVMGKHGYGQRNAEGQAVVDFAKRMEMAITNTYFKKEEDSRATYRSGGRSTQICYILCKGGTRNHVRQQQAE